MNTLTTIETQAIQTLRAKQQAYFRAGKTLSPAFRKEMLLKLRAAIQAREKQLLEALYKDLGKHEFEAYGTELGLVMAELEGAIKNVMSWAKPRSVATPMLHFIAKSYIHPDPYGNILLIAPWNYPLQLLLLPLVGAIAAGNTVVIKPSEYSVHTSALISQMLRETFPEEYIGVVEGGIEPTQALLVEKWDYIFFTGSVPVGKLIYQAAAKYLTPVTLELGGKSPCIVDSDIHLEYTAKRLLWGKLTNAGQTCVAPDYLLVHSSVKNKLIARMKELIKEWHQGDSENSPYYGHIINEKHFNRLTALIDPERVIAGGRTNASKLYIEPTFLEVDSWDLPVMQEEIFGPILPILTYTKLEDAIAQVNAQPKPLALYFFSDNSANVKKVLREVSAGGVCINETLMHLASHNLPFGGVGDSGIGNYHGKKSFDTFSHLKSVLHKSNLIDLPVRYAPYVPTKVLKFLMDWML